MTLSTTVQTAIQSLQLNTVESGASLGIFGSSLTNVATPNDIDLVVMATPADEDELLDTIRDWARRCGPARIELNCYDGAPIERQQPKFHVVVATDQGFKEKFLRINPNVQWLKKAV